MNKEYIYLSDNEIIVTDENGHTEKRIVECDDMHELLLLENNLENINNYINKVKDYLNANTDLNLKKASILMFLIFPLGVVIKDFGFHLANFSIFDPVTLLVDFGFITIGGVSTTFEYIKSKKQTLGVKSQLSKAYEIKEKLEKELVHIRTKKQSVSETKKSEMAPAQKEITVLDNDAEFEKIGVELADSYRQGYNQGKVRKLTFKK